MRRVALPGVGLAVSLSVACAASVSRAESIEGRWRLGFQAGLVEREVATVTFGTSRSTQTSAEVTTVGVGATPLGPFIGYGLSANTLVGLHFSLYNRNGSVGEGPSSDVLGANVDATLAYVVDGRPGRVFIGPIVGMSLLDIDGDIDERRFHFGMQAGLLGFATRSFSIDPSLFVTFGTGSGTQPVDQGAGPSPRDYDLGSVHFGIRLAFSGWLGGGSGTEDEILGYRELYATPPDVP